MSGGESFGGSRRAVSRSGDTRSPGARGSAGDAGVPATLCRRTQKPDANHTKQQGTLYSAHNLRPAFSLLYDWTGWPTAGTTLPLQTVAVARETAPLWESDGLHLLKPHATADMVQILFGVTPQVCPTFFCQRVSCSPSPGSEEGSHLCSSCRDESPPQPFRRSSCVAQDAVRGHRMETVLKNTCYFVMG
jgi:hypothetical protein